MSFPKTFNKFDLTKCAAEQMVYLERHKLLEIMTQLLAEISILRPDDPRIWIAKNIGRIADGIYKNCLKVRQEGGGSNQCSFYQLPRRFHHRVAIYGRRGSGCHSQGLSLARLFNLVFIDADLLIHRCLSEKDEKAKELQKAFAEDDVKEKSKALCRIVSERFLQRDCLEKGWVIVNFPNNIYECTELFEKFTVPPNKFVYLDCSEEIAKKRSALKPELDCPQDLTSHIERQLEYFKEQEPEMIEYLGRRQEVLCVDAVPCFEEVRSTLLGKLEQVPYVMGFKQL